MTSRTEEPWLIPVRGLNEFVYCPRLFHLMYVQGLFQESVDTIEGRIAHQKPLNRGKTVAVEENPDASPWPTAVVREMALSSERYGIIGKFDILLADGDETIPVEVKHGPAPDGTSRFSVGNHLLSATAWDNDQVQLGAQMALLREAGHACSRGRLFYRGSSTMADIAWDDALDAALYWSVKESRKLAAMPMPDPLVDSPKCIRCSLNHVCLPDETLHLKRVIQEPRQLFPGRDDSGILHLVTPGARLGKSGEALKLNVPDQKEVTIPVKDVAHVCVWGNSQVTTQTVLELAEHGVGISWLTGGGRIRAVTYAPLEKNVALRREQYRGCDDEYRCNNLARWIVAAKIENQRTLIRRNDPDGAAEQLLRTLRDLRRKALESPTLESLRGIEGMAAKGYWEHFPLLLKSKDGEALPMKGRSKRPPQDPVNALLSFGYSMLLRDFMTALHGVGMDPMYGFYHALVPGRPALALDLMEPFRPLVVDSAVLRAINEGSFSLNDFVKLDGSCLLKPHARKRWIEAYERRVDEMVTHPVFGYRLSYRRIFTLEARLLGRYFIGEMPEYHPLTTR